jgi:rubrerythrin
MEVSDGNNIWKIISFAVEKEKEAAELYRNNGASVGVNRALPKMQRDEVSGHIKKGEMTVNLKGSKTEKNILTAFAGESQARNRYTYFASRARKDGYIQISMIFEETANQEKEHAERLFKLLKGGEVEVQAAFPAGVIGTTAENLKAAAGGEKYEWTEMYPSFAEVAREEEFDSISEIFKSIAVAEKQHEKRYLGLLANVEAGTVFKKDKPVVWRCLNCGYLHEGEEAPEVCPACAHAREYYELLCENW